MVLQEKLEFFDIPSMRRDISKIENVMWLGRNLPIKNLDNPKLNEVMTEINKLGKKMIGSLILGA